MDEANRPMTPSEARRCSIPSVASTAEAIETALNGSKPLKIWEHVRDAVLLFGDRNGVCVPQPLFDVISTLITVDPVAQQLCGVHKASMHIGSNAKIDKAFVPLIESEVQETLSAPGTMSITAREPTNQEALRKRLEDFLSGDLRITDPELVNAIHVQDIDWADVDNGSAVLALANCLKLSGAKHKMHAFVSQRRFTAEFAPSVVHMDENGSPIRSEDQSLQYRVIPDGDLSSFDVVPSIIPYVKELEFEHALHNEQDMRDLAHFEYAILLAQLRRAGLEDTAVGLSGFLETVGVSGNVHRLTWLMYDTDGRVRSPEAYRKDALEYFLCGVGNSAARRGLFHGYTKALRESTLAPGSFDQFFAYCREHPDDKIVVHCGGPVFLLRALQEQPDLRDRVVLIGAMFLAYDGLANLLGTNFNEGVATKCTLEVFGDDGLKLHRNFPNARVLCVTTETCKSPSMAFIPFEDTLSLSRGTLQDAKEEEFIPGKRAALPLLIISDDGKDPDDELAKIVVGSLKHRGLAKCYGYIANLGPSKERARLAKGTLEQLGLKEVPVAVGEDMLNQKATEYEFDAPYLANLNDCKENGVSMFVEILKGLDEDCQVTLVCLSGLADAWLLLKDHRELFKAKIARVVIMGGVEVEGENVKLDLDGFMLPDKAQNNTFDFESAKHLYRELQKENIPMTIVTRWAGYAAKLPFTIYDGMAETGHPIGIRLKKIQKHSLEHLWRRACMAEDDPNREGLPGRCNKQWFCKIFLGGAGLDREGNTSIWDLASTFQAYDAIALLAALHGVRARFLRPMLVDVEGTNGTTRHEIVGVTESNNGIAEGAALAQWLHESILQGLKAHPAHNVRITVDAARHIQA